MMIHFGSWQRLYLSLQVKLNTIFSGPEGQVLRLVETLRVRMRE